MTAVELSPVEVRRIVEARLGRDPQDMLEAAVVLEAWAGMPASDALRTGAEVMRSGDATSQPSVGALPDPPERGGMASQALTLLVTVVAIAWWAGPLSAALGASVVSRSLMVALPVSLAAQWALQSRYLGRKGGFEQLGQRRLALALGTAAMFGLGAATLGIAGLLGAVLASLWTGGLLLIRRGWAFAYAGVVSLGTAGMLVGLPATAMVAVVAGLVTGGVAAAVRPGKAPVLRQPAQHARVATAGAIGAGLGIMLVADRSLEWTTSAGPALALLPSTAAILWGGQRLWSFQQTMSGSLAGVAVAQSVSRRVAWSSLRLLADALGRVLGLTVLLSAALVASGIWLGVPAVDAAVLAGFGLIGLTTLLIGVLEAVGRAVWALAAVGCGVAVEVAVRGLDLIPVQAGGIIGGAGVALLIALPAVVALLARPATTLATTLYVR